MRIAASLTMMKSGVGDERMTECRILSTGQSIGIDKHSVIFSNYSSKLDNQFPLLILK